MMAEKQYIEAQLAELRGKIAEQHLRAGYCNQDIGKKLNALLSHLQHKLAQEHLDVPHLPAPLPVAVGGTDRLPWLEAMQFHDSLLASVLALAEKDLSPEAVGEMGFIPPIGKRAKG